MSVAPDTILFKIWVRHFRVVRENRCAIRTDNLAAFFCGQATISVARGEFWSIDQKREHPLAPCNGAFFFGTAKKGESVTFVKVTKHLP